MFQRSASQAKKVSPQVNPQTENLGRSILTQSYTDQEQVMQFSCVKQLEGRGQEGVAGFYVDVNEAAVSLDKALPKNFEKILEEKNIILVFKQNKLTVYFKHENNILSESLDSENPNVKAILALIPMASSSSNPILIHKITSSFSSVFTQQYLIKVDDETTCLLEGSAYFAEHLIPEELKQSVNFARAGSAVIDQAEASVCVSMQPKAQGYKPWDVVVTGSKRNPKIPVSYEALHANAILTSIDCMTDHAKNQLAMAIFISQIVGDESIHIGQFMVKTRMEVITDIMRIDFGARERFGMKRQGDGFKFETSSAYKSSGQFGKDYISYLLAHPEIQAKVLSFWGSNEINAETLAEKSLVTILLQLQQLPEDFRKAAFLGLRKVIFKDYLDTNANISNQDEEEGSDCLLALKGITIKRIQDLQSEAVRKINLNLQSVMQHLHLEKSSPVLFDQFYATINEIFEPSINNDITSSLDVFHTNEMKRCEADLKAFDKIKHALIHLTPAGEMVTLCHYLQAKFQCYLYDNNINCDAELKIQLNQVVEDLNDLKAKVKILNRLQTYRKNHLALRITKKEVVDKAIVALTQDLSFAFTSAKKDDITSIIGANLIARLNENGVSKSIGENLIFTLAQAKNYKSAMDALENYLAHLNASSNPSDVNDIISEKKQQIQEAKAKLESGCSVSSILTQDFVQIISQHRKVENPGQQTLREIKFFSLGCPMSLFPSSVQPQTQRNSLHSSSDKDRTQSSSDRDRAYSSSSNDLTSSFSCPGYR